ncbi:hypothetical protein KSF_109900 [Reticulibacter mediterranei]|uniref:Uncharacterized protein n=1 Tax=Reticulibacter mediterranei TaxID=2778369 RepID=A0A8J3N707_9CHLR|nr:hypothetical protein KSF_109900 [Reticulibacter mediterranei]
MYVVPSIRILSSAEERIVAGGVSVGREEGGARWHGGYVGLYETIDKRW